MVDWKNKWFIPLAVLCVILGANFGYRWIANVPEEKLPGTALTAASPVKPEDPQSLTNAANGQSDSVGKESASDTIKEKEPIKSVTVYLCGAVMKPGVYQLSEGSRINDVLQLAGGFTTKGDPLSVNLAEPLLDGQQVIVYELGETAGSVAQSKGATQYAQASAAKGKQPISLNRGTLEQLMELEGVGEKTAQKIIDYRKSQGGFKTIDELKNVPGIGDKKFEQLKNDCRL